MPTGAKCLQFGVLRCLPPGRRNEPLGSLTHQVPLPSPTRAHAHGIELGTEFFSRRSPALARIAYNVRLRGPSSSRQKAAKLGTQAKDSYRLSNRQDHFPQWRREGPTFSGELGAHPNSSASQLGVHDRLRQYIRFFSKTCWQEFVQYERFSMGRTPFGVSAA